MPANILSSEFLDLYDNLPPAEQRNSVRILQDSIAKLESRSLRALRSLGIAAAFTKPVVKHRLEHEVILALDQCRWQLCQLLRYSIPSRIDEAEPYIRGVIDHYKITVRGRSGVIDQTPLLYLATTISMQPGREDEAVVALEEAMKGSDAGPNTFLWAQAAVARALRRVGRIAEAEKLEKNIVDWFEYNPHKLLPTKFRRVVGDDKNQGAPNPILDHPKVKAVFDKTVEFPDGRTAMFGNILIHQTK